ncbi:hypothetical protein BaRGS_00000342 [Batillaria attramentaria]|uniref:Uncharacterized protein n=1 Tax=Batillaria attramentaria TaxID=370345 RepID=A0ABD0M8G5_9CAEN
MVEHSRPATTVTQTSMVGYILLRSAIPTGVGFRSSDFCVAQPCGTRARSDESVPVAAETVSLHVIHTDILGRRRLRPG